MSTKREGDTSERAQELARLFAEERARGLGGAHEFKAHLAVFLDALPEFSGQTPRITHEKLFKALCELGVMRAANASDLRRWSPSDLATDLVEKLNSKPVWIKCSPMTMPPIGADVWFGQPGYDVERKTFSGTAYTDAGFGNCFWTLAEPKPEPPVENDSPLIASMKAERKRLQDHLDARLPARSGSIDMSCARLESAVQTADDFIEMAKHLESKKGNQ